MQEEKLRDLVGVIASKLLERSATLSTAESCTGGRLASLLTGQSGASEWFAGGVVAYTRETKLKLLGIDPQELAQGLVTERCARAMASGVMSLSGSDFSVSTTGVCGPAQSEGFEPCYAWVAVRNGDREVTKLIVAEDAGRGDNIDLVALEALRFLLEEIRK